MTITDIAALSGVRSAVMTLLTVPGSRSKLSRHVAVAAIVAFFALGAGACSSDGDNASGGSGNGDTAARTDVDTTDADDGGGTGDAADECGGTFDGDLCITLTVTGSTTYTGKVGTSIEELDSCAEWATERGPFAYFYDDTEDGTEVTIEGAIEDYDGPGTYDAAALTTRIGGQSFTVQIGDAYYELSRGTTGGSITVNADGSGSFSLTDLLTVNGPTGSRIDAEATWTCRGS